MGRTLLEWAEDAIRRRQLSTASVEATLNAVGFHETRGYRRSADVDSLLPSGMSRAGVAMVKDLRRRPTRPAP